MTTPPWPTNANELVWTYWAPRNGISGSWIVTDVFHSIHGRTAVQIEKYQGGRNSPAIITTKKLRRNFKQLEK